MVHKPPTYLEEVSAAEGVLGRLRGLTTGSLVVVVAGVLLFFTLFLTWQTIEVAYPGTGIARLSQDGWDFWGLLIGFLSLTIVSLVLLFHSTDTTVVADVRWQTLTLALGVVLVGLTAVKSLTDAESAWASYVGLVLAALVAVGAYLEWGQARRR
jgi:hypothetical protein